MQDVEHTKFIKNVIHNLGEGVVIIKHIFTKQISNFKYVPINKNS